MNYNIENIEQSTGLIYTKDFGFLKEFDDISVWVKKEVNPPKVFKGKTFKYKGYQHRITGESEEYVINTIKTLFK